MHLPLRCTTSTLIAPSSITHHACTPTSFLPTPTESTPAGRAPSAADTPELLRYFAHLGSTKSPLRCGAGRQRTRDT